MMQPTVLTSPQQTSHGDTQTSSLYHSQLGESKIRVRRRDGSWTALNIAKIRAVVDWACADREVNSIALEAGLTTRLRDGITTREIQDNLINCALEMCSPDEPDWRYIAGRLHIWSLWKDTLVSRGYQYGNYEIVAKTKIDAKQYDNRLLTYSTADYKRLEVGLIQTGILTTTTLERFC